MNRPRYKQLHKEEVARTNAAADENIKLWQRIRAVEHRGVELARQNLRLKTLLGRALESLDDEECDMPDCSVCRLLPDIREALKQ